jgi:hypothetical protein
VERHDAIYQIDGDKDRDRERERERERENSNKNHFIFLEYQSCQLSRGLPRMEIGQILFLSQQQTKKSKNDILPVFFCKKCKIFLGCY